MPASASLVRLSEYTAPDWRVSSVEMEVDLDIASSRIRTRLTVHGDTDRPLHLDGEDLELLELKLDGETLADAHYRKTDSGLEIDGVRNGSVIETLVRVKPAENTKLEGLYLSGAADTGFLLTQCEAEGFRRITFFPDRPDVLATYTVTLRADRARFPVLLAGGNPDGAGDLDDGRHWARFVDPHPKPCYLFALVAGRLQKISRAYRTADGRDVTLNLWAEAGAIEQCGYAMDALERAMRWDEQTYGRNYDLDVFHVVATHDFNMGAMENKGLNIFNAKYLLAAPDMSTDDEYRHVEAVVAHEYFHNWSGNRVTCRDWFQLSLKEGLTVFREQSFSADMNSAPIKRIEDVSLLRRAQFTEDAGPLSHPVRPSEYREINNFYTATVYEKGSELVRMIAGRLGAERFRKGMDLYFERHDGDAATLEDFLAALGEANGIDLTPYLAWYGQAGTPRLRALGEYDAAQRRYTLTLRQRTPATPGQPHKQPVPIPVRVALFDRGGAMLPLQLQGETEASGHERVLELDGVEGEFVFENVPAAPIPSLLRGFSAPVVLEHDYLPEDLATLLRADPDGFNRWAAGQQLSSRAFDALLAGDASSAALRAWCDGLASLFDDTELDPALLAELLMPAAEIELAERIEQDVDPDAVRAAREALLHHLAERIGGDRLESRFDALQSVASDDLDAASQARRRLKQAVLRLLHGVRPQAALQRADALHAQAGNMTDRLLALQMLLRGPQADAAASAFRQRHHAQPLAMDKWFAAQAQVAGAQTLDRVQALLHDDAFTLRNPNRVHALLGTFARSNPTGFHRADGAGYRFLTAKLAEIDALNPQVAARLATAFNGWHRLEPMRREAAHDALATLASGNDLSRDLADILQRALEG
ncbi:aminopeptidase N [Oleiagrimonas soli]|uniref:Aminopeptidase N n=1 Tax=Oleiagrimonas soli TaxID=1543381 RepID=A0A099CSL9_9GAMM|nr:aminopeptidase N [Oleiagrimonas soli]KGI76602.1 aminopeptidase N [Oleiagrimonas soli]MBB6184917.1 aminopeptidase N [Oleiagrimonas soli]